MIQAALYGLVIIFPVLVALKFLLIQQEISGTAQLLRTDSNSGYFNESSYGTGDIYFMWWSFDSQMAMIGGPTTE